MAEEPQNVHYVDCPTLGIDVHTSARYGSQVEAVQAHTKLVGCTCPTPASGTDDQ